MTAGADRHLPVSAWYADASGGDAEIANLHSANIHDWCPSLPQRRAEHLVRRMTVALRDLGLDRCIPDGWPHPIPSGVAFRSLSYGQANRLVVALEQLGLDR
jgi:hypothetical protein